MSKKKMQRYGKAKAAHKKSKELWSSFVELEHHEKLAKVIDKLNVAEVEAFNEVMTSVYQYESRMRKQREEAERKRNNSVANGNAP